MRAWPLAASLALAQLGRGPVLLIVAGVLTAAVWGALVPFAERQAAQQQRQLDDARRAAADSPARPERSASPQVSALQAFENRLAGAQDVALLQKQLWQQARAAGLELNKVDYRSEVDAGGQFTRLSITLPVTGAYPGVRRFIFALMAQFPGLSLDKLDLKRTSVGTAQVEATMHFTLLGRP